MSDAITLLFSGIVATSTAVYAVLTWKLTTETRKMRKAQTEPRVSVYLQPDEETQGIFHLVIENVGMGPAYDIKFDIDNDIERIPGYPLSKNGFFERGISFLPPHLRYTIFFKTWIGEDYESVINTQVNVTINYRDYSGIEYSDNYCIDISQFRDMLRVGSGR